MAGRANACDAVDVEPQVDAALDGGLARMQPHAHTNLRLLRPRVGRDHPLGGNGGLDAVLRPLEGSEQLIGTTVDLVAASVRHGPSEQPPELVQDAAVTVPQLLHEPGRPLDVREEQGHGPARQLGHLHLPASG